MLPLQLAALGLAFRPPAIPLLTTDPFMQTWLMGDNSTADDVRHWDAIEKQMVGLLRVDGVGYGFLGRTCHRAAVVKPGPVVFYASHDLNPGHCDIENSADAGDADCNVRCYNEPTCEAYVLGHGRCWLKNCAAPLVASAAHNTSVLSAAHPPCVATVPALTQRSVVVMPTRTTFELEVAGVLALTLTFLQTQFTDDWVRLSRPVYYVQHAVRSLDGKPHAVSMYFDASAQHAVNTCALEAVQWSAWERPDVGLHGAKIGSAAQRVLGSKGDRVNINWGFLHLAAALGDGATAVRAGSAAQQREAFLSSGALPPGPDARQPRTCSDDLPSVATVHDFGTVGAAPKRHVVLLAYDDVASVYYFGSTYRGLWSRTYADIETAMGAAAGEFDAMLAKSIALDEKLVAEMASRAGEKYAKLGALAYRQTLGALKLVWNHDKNVTWHFLKEISTNGDMQTSAPPTLPPACPNPPPARVQLRRPLHLARRSSTPTPFRTRGQWM